MEPREQRGLVIAALCKIIGKRDTYFVPSQTHAQTTYTVNTRYASCTCPDHKEAGFKCKHLFAVEFTLKREFNRDGMTETKSFSFMEKKVYDQDWPAYNQAQSTEKKRFQTLLHDLCRNLPEPEHNGRGPKPHKVRDAIFAMAYKVYCGVSSRRFSCDLADAHTSGFVTKTIPGAKVTAFHENPDYTPILFALIERSALPLRAVEQDFAVDSTGFASSRFETWIDHKYGTCKRKCMWVKVHAACGVKTNVVTSVRILEKDTADAPQFGPLMKSTAVNFTIRETSADKAYLSAENVETVAQLGGTAFIPPKTNTTGGIGGLFEKMFHYFQFRQDEFLEHYHKRSNVESTFSAIKRKFGDNVRSRTDTAMVNEALCKILCHNICCVIQEQCELGIEPVFWSDAETERNELRIAATH